MKDDYQSQENKFRLLMASIVCSCILGVISIIGVFFGQDGLKYLGAGVIVLTILAIIFGPVMLDR